MKILIVEDDPDWANLLRIIIEEAGHTCVGVASDVEEAICASSLETPDVAILDVALRGPMLGIEGARILRGYFPAIGLIFASGYSDPCVVESTNALRPIAYLVKPVAPAQMLATLVAAEAAHRTTAPPAAPRSPRPVPPADLVELPDTVRTADETPSAKKIRAAAEGSTE